MHPAYQRLRGLLMVLLFACLNCAGCSSPDGVNKMNSALSNESEELVAKWIVVDSKGTHIKERKCSSKERQALRFLATPRFKKRLIEKEIATYEGMSWVEANGRRWNIYLNSIYAEGQTRLERYFPSQPIEFGTIDDAGEIEFAQLVTWYEIQESK